MLALESYLTKACHETFPNYIIVQSAWACALVGIYYFLSDNLAPSVLRNLSLAHFLSIWMRPLCILTSLANLYDKISLAKEWKLQAPKTYVARLHRYRRCRYLFMLCRHLCLWQWCHNTENCLVFKWMFAISQMFWLCNQSILHVVKSDWYWAKAWIGVENTGIWAEGSGNYAAKQLS